MTDFKCLYTTFSFPLAAGTDVGVMRGSLRKFCLCIYFSIKGSALSPFLPLGFYRDWLGVRGAASSLILPLNTMGTYG